MPVYAAVNTDGLSADDAKTIATALDFITTTGQKPGTAEGELPFGYAPLSGALADQAAAAVKTLTSPPQTPADDGASDVPSGFNDSPTDSGSQLPDIPDTPNVPDTSTVPAVNSSSGTKTLAPQSTPATEAVALRTPATAIGLPKYGLLGGLGGAVVAVIVAPILGSRRRKGL
jgi:hypothetical protein